MRLSESLNFSASGGRELGRAYQSSLRRQHCRNALTAIELAILKGSSGKDSIEMNVARLARHLGDINSLNDALSPDVSARLRDYMDVVE